MGGHGNGNEAISNLLSVPLCFPPFRQLQQQQAELEGTGDGLYEAGALALAQVWGRMNVQFKCALIEALITASFSCVPFPLL